MRLVIKLLFKLLHKHHYRVISGQEYRCTVCGKTRIIRRKRK